jgi:hypothetical protein
MHVFVKLYLNVGAFIKNNIKDVSNNLIFKYVDLWSEQTEYKADDGATDEELPFGLPACFMDIDAPSMTSIGLKGKQYQSTLTLYIAFETLADTYIGAPNQDKAMDIFEYALALFESLNGYTHTDFKGTLNSTTLRRYKSRSNLIMYALTFDVNLRDQTATDKQRPTQTVTVDAEISITKKPHHNPDVASNGDNFYDLS